MVHHLRDWLGYKRLSLKFGLVAGRQFLQCSPTESD